MPLNWTKHVDYVPVKKMDGKWETTNPKYNGPLLMASILSRNGTLGRVWIIQDFDQDGEYFYLQAESEAGRVWKVKRNTYDTIDQAQKAAEKRWKPVRPTINIAKRRLNDA